MADPPPQQNRIIYLGWIFVPIPYGPVTNAVAFMLCGSSFAVILGTSWVDILFGGLLGLVSYGITVWAKRSAGVASLTELLAAMIYAGLATIIASLLPGSNPTAVAVCAVIWIVPGFGLTIAPDEFIVENTLSGMVGLTNALTTMFKLLGGAVAGFALIQNQWHVDPPKPARGVAPAWCWVFVSLLVAALAVLFLVRKRDLIWVLLGAWAECRRTTLSVSGRVCSWACLPSSFLPGNVIACSAFRLSPSR